MCGIFGYYSFDGTTFSDEVIRKMGEIISYRGPDDFGFYNKNGRSLGNQRLSIQDLNNGGQPFFSEAADVIVVQNGEVFNHVELAEELVGTEYQCKTNCDTEVILRLYQKYGVDFVHRLNGMFAIAIYDSKLDELYLIRDRVGEKPYYYYSDNSKLIFASEIKSILASGVDPVVEYKAIDNFLSMNYVLPPYTMFENILHVMPGCYLKVSSNGVENIEWWNLSSVEEKQKTEDDWIVEFNEILEDSVRIRMRCDVPYGAFLSGGVDSSSVVGLMSKLQEKPVNTFTIGFYEERFDESIYAEEASKRFSSNHLLQKVEANLFDLWPKVTYHCDQPHGDVSFLPTYKVAELASKKVKVVLTGDGADELFAGYDKYKEFFSREINYSDTEFYNSYIVSISLFTESEKEQLFSRKLKDLLNGYDFRDDLDRYFIESNEMDRVNQALYLDTKLLLSGNNLVKPDRTGMAVSIENRAPFLDYRLIELAFSMPGGLKLKGGETKYIYKKAVSPLIGCDLAYRKKQMFTVPVGDWFKDELYNFCLDTLFSEKANTRGLFNSDYIRKLFSDHCEGLSNNTRKIRALLALEIWFGCFIDKT